MKNNTAFEISRNSFDFFGLFWILQYKIRLINGKKKKFLFPFMLSINHDFGFKHLETPSIDKWNYSKLYIPSLIKCRRFYNCKSYMDRLARRFWFRFISLCTWFWPAWWQRLFSKKYLIRKPISSFVYCIIKWALPFQSRFVHRYLNKLPTDNKSKWYSCIDWLWYGNTSLPWYYC